jgi:hypothetical protein
MQLVSKSKQNQKIHRSAKASRYHKKENKMAVKRNLVDEKGNKVKISQAEIDAVKKMGMKAALKAAGKNPVVGASSSDAKNFKQAKLVEAVRRLYGETRFQNAIYTPKASPGPAMPSSRAAYKVERLKNPANR